jgi:glycosyltransferase involved in cell wall biosynthesis
VRIGYDAKRLYNNFTGLGNYSRFIVDGIHSSFPEEDIYLFTPKVTNHPEVKVYQNDSSLTTILPSHILQQLKLGSYWRSFQLKNEARKYKLDLFHGLSHELPVGISSATNSVVTVHDLIFIRYPEFYKPMDRWIYTQKIKYACKEADVIVAISEQTKNDLIEFLHVPSHKIRVVYQGCHPNFKRRFTEEELGEVRKKYQLPEKFLLNVGTMEKRKNSLSILKALNELKESTTVPLVMVGRPTAYLDTLKAYAQEHQLENRVHYIHKASFLDLPAIYQLSEAFVYPSLFEGFGIPLVEAIACNTPVITSTGSCFSEAAGPASFYVSPNDIQELAAAIQQVLTDKELRQKMIIESANFIQKFEPAVIAKDMMNVYRSIAV